MSIVIKLNVAIANLREVESTHEQKRYMMQVLPCHMNPSM
jgi:hypothetical protein